MVWLSRLSPIALVVAAVLLAGPVYAEDLEVGAAATLNLAGAPGVRVDVAWRNAWHSERNHDGVWMFFKWQGRHLQVARDGHRVIDAQGDAPRVRVVVAEDGSGLWLVPRRPYPGDIDVRLIVALVIDAERDNLGQGPVAAYGIEMVHVPAGGFWIGDPGSRAREYSGFHRAGADGREGLVRVDSEAAIEVGSSPGQLTYDPGGGGYGGDVGGPIPAAFPKGTEAFWLMKYELSQGEYAAFLNALWDDATFERALLGGRGYEDNRGSIRLAGGRYVAEHPKRAANFLRWDDQLAFTDWAALRPMTELEFTKAARGPAEPVADEFPWGTPSRDALIRVVNAAGDLVHSDGSDESALTDARRAVYGASYYWVMDLAGSVWERVISVGSPDGRRFVGSHGDGALGDRARADNADWPHEHAGRNGHGYRGGGYYGPDAAWHEFNPYSPVAYRRFGGWAGHAPHRAYGYRAARSAS